MHEVHQLRYEGKDYFADPYNWIDGFVGILGTGTLVVMACKQATTGGEHHSVAALKAIAGLSCWLKVLWFIRGLTFKSAFLLNMLLAIVKVPHTALLGR